MKEQNKYDQMLSNLSDRLQRVLPLTKKVVDKIVGEETEILNEIMPRMFEVIQRIAISSCEYVKHGGFSRRSLFWILELLMTAERTGDALIYSKNKEMMEEMDRELANLTEDFLRALDVETLRIAKRIGKHTVSILRQPILNSFV